MNSQKNQLVKLCLSVFFTLSVLTSFADGGLNTYYKVGTFNGSMTDAVAKVKGALTGADNPFEVIGEYSPARDASMYVVAFTRKDLTNICLQVPDRGIMASVLRVGLLEKTPGQVDISLLNPEYLFYAYLRNSVEKFQVELAGISMDVRIAMINVGQQFMPFGGSASEMELQHFRFTSSMPSFEEPVLIREFPSFEEGVKKIELNLRSRKKATLQVYKQVFRDKKVAIFGVGMNDNRMGEGNFMKKLGVEHLAAMPYEIVLQGSKATILPVRYRLPLFWSDQPIRKHQRLYKTPRDIKEVMKALAN